MPDVRALNFNNPSASPVHPSFAQHTPSPTQMESVADAVARLNAAARQSEAVDTIFEIACGLLGAGEAALYTVEWNVAMLRLIGSRGIGAHVLIKMGAGRIGEAALSGKEYVADTEVPPTGQATDDRLTLCIPLIHNDTPAFVLAVYGLLPHKPHLHKNDLAVVRFLKERAAPALLRFQE